MLRTLFLIAIALCLAILGGVWSVNYILAHFDGFNRMHIGQWQAFPLTGTEEADPYTLARAIRRNDFALGRAEGLAFYLWKDDQGRTLNSRCRYLLKGFVPETRFFTLYPVDNNLVPQQAGALLPSVFHSQNIIRDEKGKIQVLISSTAEPGNWLAVKSRQNYGLALVLYDTPITTTTGLANPVMPKLIRIKERRCE